MIVNPKVPKPGSTAASCDCDSTRIDVTTRVRRQDFLIAAATLLPTIHNQRPLYEDMPPKRKSDQAEPTSRSKRTHKDNDHSAAIDLVDAILTDPADFDIPDDDDELRNIMVSLAEYARTLEGRAATTSASAGGMGTAAPEKSPEELLVEAEKIRKAAVAGIKKQMTVSVLRVALYPL